MKQQLLFAAVAALAAASCSKDEPADMNKGGAIGFRAAMETRAVETTTANIQNFYVTAIDRNNANYFTDAQFVKDGTSFVSSPAYYWPGDGSSLAFYAYAPSAAELGAAVTVTQATKTLVDFSPAVTITGQKDFITAQATGNKDAADTGVALQFGHRLAQIEIKAKNTNSGYVYKVQGVRIGQPVSKGTFNFATNAWTLGTEKARYEATYTATRTLTATAASIMAADGDNAMLIPQQLVAWTPDTDKSNAAKGAYLAVKVNITTKNGARVYPAASVGEYDWVAVAVNTNWQAGQKYTYTLDFSGGAGRVDPEKKEPTDPADPFKPGANVLGSAIKFTVSVTPWVDASQNMGM